MQAIGYFLVLPFIYLISLLPFPILYLLSDLVFFFLYYIVGYRKKVVTEKLQRSFPEKSDADIAALRKKFFRYLSDLFVESFKTLTISKATMLKHCSMDESSVQLMEKLYREKKSCVIVLGHHGNWEWAGNTFSMICKQPLYVIYHPLQHHYFNSLIIRMRTRFGTGLIQMRNTFKDMVALKEQVTATAFIADQTPPPEGAYWTNFLNQDTPVFWGTEKIARKLNFPVVFIDVKRTGRGFYTIKAEMLCEAPAATAEGEISEMHTRKLEKQILTQPETWLWSHRRWKHTRPKG